MIQFKAYKLEFICETTAPVSLPRFKGSTLRGSFFGALRQDFCLNRNLNTCLDCPTSGVCPICHLVATVERDNSRGAEIPRPFALEPVMTEKTQYASGELFSFGITLFGESLNLFPYAILAVRRMGEIGLGNQKVAPGRFILKSARVINPLTGAQKSIYTENTRIVQVPDLAVTNRDVLIYSSGLNPSNLSLSLISPLRLVIESALVQKLTFRPFIQRLLRRLTDLSDYYCKEKLELNFPVLLKQAEEVRVTQDDTRWIDLSSYSSRRQASTPVGGLIGNISFAGNLKEYLPLLVWGQITHVGKDATRGNGWYRIADSSL